MMPGRYPMVSPNRNAHFLVGKIMNADGSADMEKTKEIEKQSFELLEQAFQRTDRVILSDEAIWNTYKGDHPECLEKIRAFCEQHGIALKLIVYLRRQDQYLESYWKQQIRRKGVTWKWDRMVKRTPHYIVLDYYHHLQVLAGFAGKENIIVQPYYEENFDLCSDFLRVLGITDMDAFEPLESKVNLSLNNNYAEIKRIINGLLSDDLPGGTENSAGWRSLSWIVRAQRKSNMKALCFPWKNDRNLWSASMRSISGSPENIWDKSRFSMPDRRRSCRNGRRTMTCSTKIRFFSLERHCLI